MLVIPYNSPDHCVPIDFSMFQAKDISHLVYHFQSLIWCGIVSANKSINDWTLDSTCRVEICNLCVPLFPCGRNRQLRSLPHPHCTQTPLTTLFQFKKWNLQLHFASSYERNISFSLHQLLPHHQHLVCGFHWMKLDVLWGGTHQELLS